MGPTGQQFPLKRTVGTVRQLGRVLRIFADQGQAIFRNPWNIDFGYRVAVDAKARPHCVITVAIFDMF
jgi:hypothetical protein